MRIDLFKGNEVLIFYSNSSYNCLVRPSVLVALLPHSLKAMKLGRSWYILYYIKSYLLLVLATLTACNQLSNPNFSNGLLGQAI